MFVRMSKSEPESWPLPLKLGRTSAPPFPVRPSPTVLILWSLIALGCALRLANPFLPGHNPLDQLWSDPARHWNNATDLLGKTPLHAINQIGYQLWLAAIAKFTLDIPALVAAYAGLLSVANTWIWYRFFREFFRRKTTALLAWVAILYLPSWFGIFRLFMSETLFIPLVGLSLWMTWRCQRKQTVGAFVAMGLCWTFAGLTRGVAIPMAAVATLYLWILQREKLQKAFALGLPLAAILLACAYRTYALTGVFHPLSSGHYDYAYAVSGNKTVHLDFHENGTTRYTYWFGSPSMNEQPFRPFSDWKTKRSGALQFTIDLNHQRESWRTAFTAAAATNPSWWPWLPENLIFLFFGSSWPDNNPAIFVDRLTIHLRWLFAPLFVLTFTTLWLCRRERRHDCALLGLILLTWFAVQGLTPIVLNEGRYRKPVEALVLCVPLLLWERKRQSKQV